MRTFIYTITDIAGLHARPCGELMKLMECYECEGYISTKLEDRKESLSDPIGLLGLGICQGEEVAVSVNGVDEDSAYDALFKYFSNNL